MGRNFVVLFALTLFAVSALASVLVAQEQPKLFGPTPGCASEFPPQTFTMSGSLNFITGTLCVERVKPKPGEDIAVIFSVRAQNAPPSPYDKLPFDVKVNIQRAQIPAGGSVSVAGEAVFESLKVGVVQEGSGHVSAGPQPKPYAIVIRVEPFGHSWMAESFEFPVSWP